MPAFRAPITQARSPARLIRGVVLKVALAGGPSADGAGAGRVPDLGQVPQPDPGIMAPGFVPVPAVPGVQGVDRHDQVRPAAGNAQPPGAVPARRAIPVGRGKGEPGLARRRTHPRCCRAARRRAGDAPCRRPGRPRCRRTPAGPVPSQAPRSAHTLAKRLRAQPAILTAGDAKGDRGPRRSHSPRRPYRGPLRWDLAVRDRGWRRCTVSPVVGRVSRNIRVDRSRIAL